MYDRRRPRPRRDRRSYRKVSIVTREKFFIEPNAQDVESGRLRVAVVVKRKRGKVVLPREWTVKALHALVNEARKGDLEARSKLEHFYTQEMEIRMLKKQGYLRGQHDIRVHQWEEPALFSHLAFRGAFDRWSAQGKSYDPKTFSRELMASFIQEFRRLTVLTHIMRGKQKIELSHDTFEEMDRLLFPEFGYLKRKQQTIEDFHHEFRIGLWKWLIERQKEILVFGPHTQLLDTRRELGEKIRMEMDMGSDPSSRILQQAKSLDEPIKSRGRSEIRADNLASEPSKAYGYFRVIFPAPHSRVELGRQRSFANLIWGQLGRKESRLKKLEEWASGERKPKIAVISYDIGSEFSIQKPSLQDLRKLYDEWAANPGHIQLRWGGFWDF
jgi:hypothetical protein